MRQRVPMVSRRRSPATVGFSSDDKPTVNSQDELAVATSPISPVTHHPLFNTTPASAPPIFQHHPGARSATPPNLGGEPRIQGRRLPPQRVNSHRRLQALKGRVIEFKLEKAGERLDCLLDADSILNALKAPARFFHTRRAP